MQPRYERISFCKENVFAFGGNYEDYYRKIEEFADEEIQNENILDPEWDGRVERACASAMMYAMDLPCLRHCEFPTTLTDDHCKMLLQRSIKIALYYFYDNWFKRELYTRQMMEWSRIVPDALFVTLLCGDYAATEKILDWLDDDVIESGDHIFEITEMDARVLVLLAAFVCGRPKEKYQPLVEKIRAGKKRRAKFMLSILEAIEAKDDAAFAKAFQDFVKYYIKSEIKLDSGTYGSLCILGSILWEVARWKGIHLPTLPDEMMDRIVTRETVRLF